MQRFINEITELRALGFAESLPIHSMDRTSDVVARLACGRIGVAVEFRTDAGAPRYAVQSLVPDPGHAPTITDNWGEIVKDIRRRAPIDEDDD